MQDSVENLPDKCLTVNLKSIFVRRRLAFFLHFKKAQIDTREKCKIFGARVSTSYHYVPYYI